MCDHRKMYEQQNVVITTKCSESHVLQNVVEVDGTIGLI